MTGYSNNSTTDPNTPSNEATKLSYLVVVSVYALLTAWLFLSFLMHLIAKKMWKKAKSVSLLIMLATLGPLLSIFTLALEVLMLEPGGLEVTDTAYFYLCKSVIILQMVETFRCHLFLWLRQNFLYSSSVFASYNSARVKTVSLVSLTMIALMFVGAGVLTFVERNCCTRGEECEVDALVLGRRVLVDAWNVLAHVSLFLLFYLPTSQKHTSRKRGKKEAEEANKDQVKRDVQMRWSRLIRWCFCRALICIGSACAVFAMNFYRQQDMLKYIVTYSGYLLVNQWSTVLAYEDCLLLVFRPFMVVGDCFKKVFCC